MMKSGVGALVVSLAIVLLLSRPCDSSPQRLLIAQHNPGQKDSQAGFQETLRRLGTVKSNGATSDKPIFSLKGIKSVDGLILQQEYRFIGKCTTYFSPLGIRVESNTLSILFNSKTLVICIFSEETKKFYACDPDTWRKKSKVMFKNNVPVHKETPWKFVKDEKISGMPAKAYTRFSYMSSSRNEDIIWVTKEIQLTKEARNLLYSLLKVIGDVPEGVPLRHQLITKNEAVKASKPDFLGRRRERKKPDYNDVDYQTYSIVKAKIPVSKYSLPTGYKKAASEMEVFFNAEDTFGGLDMPELDSPGSNSKNTPRPR